MTTEMKRAIIAAALSFAVLLGWSYFFPSKQDPTPTDKPAGTQSTQTPPVRPASPVNIPDAPSPTSPTVAPTKGERIAVATPLYTMRFNTAGGLVENVRLRRYAIAPRPGSPAVELIDDEAISRAPLGLYWNDQQTYTAAAWTFEGGDLNLAPGETGKLVFTGRLDDLVLRRVLTFDADSYAVREETTVTTASGASASGRLTYSLAATRLTGENEQYNQTLIAALNADGLEDEGDTDDLAEEGFVAGNNLEWGALESNYFLLAMAPQDAQATFRAGYGDGIYAMRLAYEPMTVPAGSQQTVRTTYYFGPKREKDLQEALPSLTNAIDYGFFDVISKPLMKGVKWFAELTGNYGIGIIILTIIIKIIFWPLSHKSYKSMNQMKKIQPLMMQIREKYKEDRQRMNQEMMQLYKTYKVNPASGCLPMIVQIPVFIGLYQALMGAIELRHAPFISHIPFTDYLWLVDLSAKDPYYITPLVMGATMFLQQRLTPTPGDPTQAKIMMFLPVVFTFIFINFPAGLVLYWLTNNVLSIAQQWWMIRKS
jgi:YidC/Oxa1 family membrane protein insertase